MLSTLMKSLILAVSATASFAMANTVENTDPIVLSSKLRSMIYKSAKQFFGLRKGNYFVQGRLLSDQVFIGMEIPDPVLRLADGNYLESGCRRHSCDEKGALIVTPAGKILAAGLITFHCGRISVHEVSCDPQLTMFVKETSDQSMLLHELKGWAERNKSTAPEEIKILR